MTNDIYMVCAYTRSNGDVYEYEATYDNGSRKLYTRGTGLPDKVVDFILSPKVTTHKFDNRIMYVRG